MRIAAAAAALLLLPVALQAQHDTVPATSPGVVLPLPPPVPAPVTTPVAPRVPDAFVQDRISDRVASGRNRGIVAAVVDPEGIRYFSAGYARDALTAPVDEHTVFEIASVTKVLTAVLLAEMAERQELRLDNYAAMYLPDTMRMPAEGGDSITLRHLATHTSGLPRLPFNLNARDIRNPYGAYGPAQLYAFLGSYGMQRAPGQQYEYSNLGFGLLGHLLALRAGATYQALLLERVARPLGMRETMIVLGPTLQSRLAVGHDASGEPTSQWDYDVLAGGGAVRSTVTDMAMFVRAALESARTDDDRPIIRALRTSMEPQMEVQGGRAVMGLGWHIIERGGQRLVLHNGRSGGFASFVGLDPERQVGVVLLTNSSAPVDDLGFAVLQQAR